MLLWGRRGKPPVSLRGQQGQIPIPRRELVLTPPPGSSPRWKSSPGVQTGDSSSLTLLQTWALPGRSFPWTQTPLQLEGSGKWAAGSSAPLWGPQMTPGSAVPVVGWRSETRVPFPLPGRAPEAKPPPSPLQPAPPGPTGPKAGAHSPSAPRFPAAGPGASGGRIHPRPGRSRPVRSQLPRLPGSAPRPRQRGPDTGRWTSRPKVSSEERGGAGRGGAGGGGEEKGRERKGRGASDWEEGERGRRGRLLSHRKPLGRLVAGSRPQATNNKNNEVLPMSLCVCMYVPFVIFFHLILTIL